MRFATYLAIAAINVGCAITPQQEAAFMAAMAAQSYPVPPYATPTPMSLEQQYLQSNVEGDIYWMKQDMMNAIFCRQMGGSC